MFTLQPLTLTNYHIIYFCEKNLQFAVLWSIVFQTISWQKLLLVTQEMDYKIEVLIMQFCTDLTQDMQYNVFIYKV